MEQYKTCSKCRVNKSLDNFHKDKQSKDGKRSQCKSCVKAYYQVNQKRLLKSSAIYRKTNPNTAQMWRKANKQKIAEYQIAYRAINPEVVRARVQRYRARKLQAKNFRVTTDEIRAMLSKPCIYCGDKSQTIEHIIPLSRGGDHGIGNLTGCCEACNFSKNDKTIMEWRLWKMRLGLHE